MGICLGSSRRESCHDTSQPCCPRRDCHVLSASALANAPSAPAAKPTPAATPTPSPEEARDALNRAQAEAAQQQVGENFAREDNYAEAVKARAATIKRQQETYAASLATYAAQKAQYAADLAKWQADAAACRAGKRRFCAKQ